MKRKLITLAAILALTLGFVSPTALLADAKAPFAQLPWIHEGLLLTFTWTAVRNGTSATGFNQSIITCIDGQNVYFSSQGFGGVSPLNNQPVPLMGTLTYSVNVESADDFWMDPARLAKMKTAPDQGVLVNAGPWKEGDHNVDSIRVTVQGGGSITDHVYDAKTGLCLHYETGGGAAVTGVGNDSTITKGDFVNMRDVNIPWATENTPDWVGQFKALHYRGSVIFHGALPTFPNVLAIDLTNQKTGPGWVQVQSTVTQQMQNAPPPMPSTQQQFYGHCELGLWAGPSALANLHPGQLLDDDPVTLMKTTVSAVDANSVSIASQNNCGEMDYRYDKQTGMLTGSSFFSAMTQQQWTVQLQSKE